jgi:hypothetical protein
MRKQLTCRIALAALLGATLAVGTAFAQWEPAQRLTFDDSLSTTTQSSKWCVAATGDTVHVVWLDSRDDTAQFWNPEIYYKRSTNRGVNWGPDIRLTYDPLYSANPSIAVSGSMVHVVWEDDRDFAMDIYHKRSTDGGTSWGADNNIAPNLPSSQFPSVAASGSTVHVTWEDWQDGVYTDIYYIRSTNEGTDWGSPTSITNAAPSWQINNTLAVSGANVHVAWTDYRNGFPWCDIYHARSTDSGVMWSSNTRLTYELQNSTSPSIAVSGTDVHIARWRGHYLRSTDNGTSWRPETYFTTDTLYVGNPSIAVSGANIHLAWQSGQGNDEIYYSRSTDGGVSWSSPPINISNNPDTSEFPSIAVAGPTVHVVWTDYRDGNAEIYYARNPTGNSGVEEFESAKFTTREIQNSKLKVNPNPFTSHASALGEERETFSLYDVAGRKVGIFRGNRIGEGLSPGVYFLRPEDRSAKPVRIVKLR